MNYLPEPITRVERYLARIAGNTDVSIPEKPITRKEHYLAAWAEKSTFQDITVTGNPAVLDNATGKPFRDLHIYGRSEQVTTTGAQLLDLTDLIGKTETKNGATYKINEDQSISVSGTPTEYTSFYLKRMQLKAGSYYFESNQNNNNVFIQMLGNQVNMNNGFTLDEDADTIDVYMVFSVLPNNKQEFNLTFTSMLNAGETPLPWEPYTGGKPSPSPDYPQEIVSAGDSGNVNVTVRGKNLIPPNIEWKNTGWGGSIKNTEGVVTATALNGWGVFVFRSPAKGKIVTLSFAYRQIETTSDATTDAFAVVTLPLITYPKGTMLYTTRSPKTEESKINVTFTSDEYIGVFMRVSKEGEGLMRKVELKNIQLEEASAPTTYEPYHEPQSISVNTPNGLPGIPVTSGGNYTDENGQQWICDEVDLGRGVYVQRVCTVDIAELEYSASTILQTVKRIFYKIQVPSTGIANKGYCNRLTYSANYTADNPHFYVNEERAVVFVPADAIIKPKEYLVQYVMANPIETPLTASEIAAYKSLRTYKGTTIVEAGDKAGISVTYTKFKERSM